MKKNDFRTSSEIRYGWVCPICGGVYSPNTSACVNCQPMPTIMTSSPSIGNSNEYKSTYTTTWEYSPTITKTAEQDLNYIQEFRNNCIKQER